MQRMCGIIARVGLVAFIVAIADVWSPARGDLIRSSPTRSFPDIAGDIVGTQTYTYDPVSQTGTFQVERTPPDLAGAPGQGHGPHGA